MASMVPILSPSGSTMVAPCQLRTVSRSGMCILSLLFVVGRLAGVREVGRPGERDDPPGAPPGRSCVSGRGRYRPVDDDRVSAAPDRKPVRLVKIYVKVLGIGWSRRGADCFGR